MTTRLRILLLSVCIVLAACSLDRSEPSAERTAEPADRQSRSMLTGHVLNGRLLYVRDGRLWLLEGKNARQLRLEGSVRDPAWSPDGQRVAFIQRQESFSDLYLLDLASGRTTQVTDNGRASAAPRTREYVHQLYWAAKPAWSPEADEIVFLSQEETATTEEAQPPIYEYPLSLYRYQISLIGTREPNNSDLLRVDQNDRDLLSPAWSPDGRYLAYVEAARDTTPRRIMVYDFELEQAAPYPGIPEGAYDPAWSPDGARLAFAVPQGGATDIWTINSPATNGTAQRVTTLGRARAPVWAPDGQSIAFLNVGEASTDLYVVELRQENGRLEPGEPIAVTRGANIDATAGMSWSE